MTDETGELPEGWATAALGEIADCRLGKMLDQAKNRGELRPYLRNTNVQWGSIGLDDIKEMRIEDDERERYGVRAGDLIVCEGGEPGRCAVWRGDREMYLQKALHRVRAHDGVSADYLRWWLQQAAGSGQLEDLFTGSTIKHLPGRQLARLRIPLPPSVEQARIARRLDDVEACLARIRNRMGAASSALDRLRHEVLAAACAGRLTSTWRAHNPDALSVEQALSEVVTKTRRKADVSTDDLALPELPETYLVSTIGAASLRIEYGTSRRAGPAGDVPVLRMGNIQDGRLSVGVDSLKYLDADAETAALMLEDSDLLFNRTNSPELVGKSAVFHEHRPMTFASYLIRVRLAPDVADSDFVNYWLQSSWGRQWARNVKTDGVSQSNINGTKLAAMPVPLPPLEEQREIVRLTDTMLATAESLAVRIAGAAVTLDQAGKAWLARAFRGEIVPTEASLAEVEGRWFESAEEMLARLSEAHPSKSTRSRRAPISA